MCNTPPDISCAVGMLAQVTEGMYEEESITATNKVVRYILQFPNIGIHNPPLDVNTAVLDVYADYTLSNNQD